MSDSTFECVENVGRNDCYMYNTVSVHSSDIESLLRSSIVVEFFVSFIFILLLLIILPIFLLVIIIAVVVFLSVFVITVIIVTTEVKLYKGRRSRNEDLAYRTVKCVYVRSKANLRPLLNSICSHSLCTIVLRQSALT